MGMKNETVGSIIMDLKFNRKPKPGSRKYEVSFRLRLSLEELPLNVIVSLNSILERLTPPFTKMKGDNPSVELSSMKNLPEPPKTKLDPV